MIHRLIEYIGLLLDKYMPAIVAGMVGAIIAKIRSKMALTAFLGTIVISIFTSIAVMDIAKEYLEIEKNSVINVLCGIAGAFARTILDVIEDIIKSSKSIILSKLGVSDKKEDE